MASFFDSIQSNSEEIGSQRGSFFDGISQEKTKRIASQPQTRKASFFDDAPSESMPSTKPSTKRRSTLKQTDGLNPIKMTQDFIYQWARANPDAALVAQENLKKASDALLHPPELRLDEKIKAPIKTGNEKRDFVANIPSELAGGLVESVVNTPSYYVKGSMGTGRNIGRSIRGEEVEPQEYLADVAPLFEALLNVATLGVGKEAVKVIGKEPFKDVLKKGAKEGGKYGAAYGGLQGLEEGKDKTLAEQLTDAIKTAGIDAVIGIITGAGITGGAHGVRKGTQLIKEMTPEERQKGFVDFSAKVGEENPEVKDLQDKIRMPDSFKDENEQNAFTKLTNDPRKVIDEYKDSFQNEVSPDLALKLLPEYKGYNADSFSRVTGAIKNIVYDDTLAKNKGEKNNTILVTAGGPGSGKTKAVSTDRPLREKYAVVLDTTFSSGGALDDIQKALDQGYKVQINDVIRDPLDAWRSGVLPRVRDEGRIITEGYFPTAHEHAQKNILDAYARYGDNPNVAFKFFRNTEHGYERASIDDVKKITYNTSDIAEKIKTATEKAYESGRLTKEEYQAITADRGARLQGRPNNDRRGQGLYSQSERSSGSGEKGQLPSQSPSGGQGASETSRQSQPKPLNQINYSKEATAEIDQRLNNLAPIRSRGKGSATNITDADNPLMKKAEGRKEMGMLLNYPKVLAGRGYTGEQIKAISYPMAKEIMEKNISPTDSAALSALRKKSAENYTSLKDIIETGVDPDIEAKETARAADMDAKFKNVIDELDAKYAEKAKQRSEINTENAKAAGIRDIQPSKNNATEKHFTRTPAEEFDDYANRTGLDVKEKVALWEYIRTPDRVLRKIGLGREADDLRKAYDSYLKELPEEIDKITAWSKRVSKESNERIFRHLDGDGGPLTPKEQQVADEIKGYLKEWAVKLDLPEDKRIAHYITHIFEQDFIQKEFDPDLAKILRDKVAGSVYDPFLEQRLGKQGYVQDTWRALDAYVKRATRKNNLDPVLNTIKQKADSLEESQYDYVKNYIDRVNMRPTKIDNLVDNWIKQVVGYKFGQRPTTNISQKIRQATYRGALGLNVGSALRNLTQGSNTYARLGERYTVIGYTKTMKNLPRFLMNKDTELEKVGVLRDDFIQDRTINATHKFWENADKGLFYLFQTVEKINRGTAYYGAKAKYLAKNKNATEEEAIKYAKDIVRDTQFTFGSVDTPVALQSDWVKVLSQFQSYNVKQAEFLGEMVKNKDFPGLIRFTLASFVVATTVGQAIGMDDWQDFVPFGSVSTGETKLGQTPIIKTIGEIIRMGTGGKDQYGNENEPWFMDELSGLSDDIMNMDAAKFLELAKTVAPFVPGGVQMVKSGESALDYNEGASYTPSGRKRFDVEQTPENLIQSLLLGRYSTEAGREYIRNLGKSKAQVIYDELSTMDEEEANKRIQVLWEENPELVNEVEKIGIYESLDLSENEKKIANLSVKDSSRAHAIAKELNKKRTEEEMNEYLQKMWEAKIITDDVSVQIQEMIDEGIIRSPEE